MVIRRRRAAEIFITIRNRKPATTNPSAAIRSISTGISEVEVVPVGLLVDGLSREVFFASSDTEVSTVGLRDSVWASLGAVVDSDAITAATGGSGHAGVAVGARAGTAGSLKCDDGLANAWGIDEAELPCEVAFGALCWRDWGEVALLTDAGRGLTARTLTRGKDGVLSPGLIDIGMLADAAAGSSVEMGGAGDGLAPSDVASASAGCAG